MTTTLIKELWEQLKFASQCPQLTDEQTKFMLPIFKEEAVAREVKRINYLLRTSGIKRIKRLEDFDWKFNPQLSRNEIMAFSETSSMGKNIRSIHRYGYSGSIESKREFYYL